MRLPTAHGHGRRSSPSSRCRRGFTSVGAVGQEPNWYPYREGSPSVLAAALSYSGIGSSVLTCAGSARRRSNSPLRGHRARGSLCPHGDSGPEKTLFASVGPNSLLRSHRQATSGAVAEGDLRPEDSSEPSWMKPTRGHRSDKIPQSKDDCHPSMAWSLSPHQPDWGLRGQAMRPYLSRPRRFLLFWLRSALLWPDWPWRAV
jgi:hypothetical protein